jgi:hypothetical protein
LASAGVARFVGDNGEVFPNLSCSVKEYLFNR